MALSCQGYGSSHSQRLSPFSYQSSAQFPTKAGKSLAFYLGDTCHLLVPEHLLGASPTSNEATEVQERGF